MRQDRGSGVAGRGSLEPVPQATAAWLSVLVLSVISIVSWIDRSILSLLVTPIEHDLGLSDSQFGLLFGMGFVVVYVVAGFPIAMALDRGNRKWILTGAVLLWCASTIAAAFANSFAALLITRSGVALGEATLMPAALSMISDFFPHSRRRLPTVVFMTVVIISGTGAYLIGGLVAGWATHVGVWNQLVSWRLTLIIVGAMGIAPAAALSLTREPSRSAPPVGSAIAVGTWKHFRGYAPLYVCMFVGTGLLTMMAQASGAWLPTLLTRDFGLQPVKTGALTALTFAPPGVLAVTLVPALVGRRAGRAAVLRLLALALLACAVSLPFALAVHGGALTLILAAGAFAMLGQGAMATLVAMLIQAVTPSSMRARMLALFYSSMSLISVGVAPLATASIASHFFVGPKALGGGLSVVALAGIVAGALCFSYAWVWSRKRSFDPV
jgi:MFS family permease